MWIWEIDFKNELEVPLEAWLWILVQFRVKTEAGKNIRAILSFFPNWGILENWGKKYV